MLFGLICPVGGLMHEIVGIWPGMAWVAGC